VAARTKKLIVVAALFAIAGGLKASGYPARSHSLVAGDLQVSGIPAKRVVSLIPALTEMLFAVGAGSQVVGVSSYDDFPEAAKALPRVGALLDPDVERILSLRPDLVITYGSQIDLEKQLGRAGIRIFSHRNGGIAKILQTLRDIGRVTGHAAEGDRRAQEIEGRLNAIRARVKGRQRPRTLLVFERQPGTLQQIYVTGGQGFLDEMLDIAGGVNVFADVRRESVQPSHETLLVRAPEVIVELRATGLFAAADEKEEKAAWSTLPSIPAVRNGRIHVLNGDYLVVPGPRIAAAAETLAGALHPDAFK
jgi:iron complex transport system substrate-binding protein